VANRCTVQGFLSCGHFLVLKCLKIVRSHDEMSSWKIRKATAQDSLLAHTDMVSQQVFHVLFYW
jgi:hypothetical protein